MKKSLFVILLACVSAPSWAQIQRTAVFDFSQPLSLTPSITPPEGNSNEVPVTDNVFSNGDITIDLSGVIRDWVQPSLTLLISILMISPIISKSVSRL